jgi:hypothetical protein
VGVFKQFSIRLQKKIEFDETRLNENELSSTDDEHVWNFLCLKCEIVAMEIAHLELMVIAMQTMQK